jgi:hypothetical protein
VLLLKAKEKLIWGRQLAVSPQDKGENQERGMGLVEHLPPQCQNPKFKLQYCQKKKTKQDEKGKRGEEKRKSKPAGQQWLMPIILATREAEIRKITVRSQAGLARPYLKNRMVE